MKSIEDHLSLLNLKGGAVIEAVDHALQEVFDNILDPNTEAQIMREVTLKIKIKPSVDRDFGNISYQAIPKLAPSAPQVTQVFIDRDVRGGAVAIERAPQVKEDEDKSKVTSIAR